MEVFFNVNSILFFIVVDGVNFVFKIIERCDFCVVRVEECNGGRFSVV